LLLMADILSNSKSKPRLLQAGSPSVSKPPLNAFVAHLEERKRQSQKQLHGYFLPKIVGETLLNTQEQSIRVSPIKQRLKDKTSIE
jgi:hypothetical protein